MNKTSHYSYRYKILFIASWYDKSPMAYAGSYIYDQAFKLSILGHEVHILFLDKSFKRFPFRTHSSFKNIFVHSISCPYPMHRIVGFYFPFLLDLHLRYFAKIIIPDVIHAHGVRPAGILANRFVRFHKAPIVITEHSGPLKSFWKSIHGYKQIENAYLNSNKLLSVSNSSKAIIEKFFPKTFGMWETVYNGVDTNKYFTKNSFVLSSTYKILFLGGLEKQKGLIVLLKAIKKIKFNVLLTVAGSNISKDAIQNLTIRFGLKDRIQSVGMVNRQDMPSLMKDHHILVLASESETFGLVVAEALACGLPVVATNCGGPAEIVTKLCGEIVPVNDTDAMSIGIEHVISNFHTYDPKLLHRHISDNFSLDSLVNRLEHIYTGLLNLETKK